MALITIGQLQVNNVQLEDVKYLISQLTELDIEQFILLPFLDPDENKVLTAAIGVDLKENLAINLLAPCPRYCYGRLNEAIKLVQNVQLITTNANTTSTFSYQEIKDNLLANYCRLVSFQVIPSQVIFGFVEVQYDVQKESFDPIDLTNPNLKIVLPN